jgi:hypothetical protein
MITIKNLKKSFLSENEKVEIFSNLNIDILD